MFDFEGVRSLHIWADYSMINITVAKPVGERCPILIRYIERRERESEILSKQWFALFCLSLSAFLLICFSLLFGLISRDLRSGPFFRFSWQREIWDWDFKSGIERVWFSFISAIPPLLMSPIEKLFYKCGPARPLEIKMRFFKWMITKQKHGKFSFLISPQKFSSNWNDQKNHFTGKT